MKTIELMINGQKAQFTTKSVTLEGKEYFYSKITQLDHSPIVLTYKFEYDGEEKFIRYEKKDAKILTAIFSQVHKMIDLKKAQAAEQPAEAAKTEQPAEAAKAEEAVKPEAESEEKVVENSEAEVEENNEAEVKEKKDDNAEETAVAEEEKAEESAAEKKKKEKEPVDPEKQAKIKKSLKIFAIIIAAVIVCAGIYYVVFGTNNAPSDANPGNTESQQYDDIDQLIEDLQ